MPHVILTCTAVPETDRRISRRKRTKERRELPPKKGFGSPDSAKAAKGKADEKEFVMPSQDEQREWIAKFREKFKAGPPAPGSQHPDCKSPGDTRTVDD